MKSDSWISHIIWNFYGEIYLGNMNIQSLVGGLEFIKNMVINSYRHKFHSFKQLQLQKLFVKTHV